MKKMSKVILIIVCLLMGSTIIYLSIEDPSMNYEQLANMYDNMGSKSEFYSYVKEDWIDYIERVKRETEDVGQAGTTPGSGGSNIPVGPGGGGTTPGAGGNTAVVTGIPAMTNGYPTNEEAQTLINVIRQSGLPTNRQQALLIMISEFYMRSDNHCGKSHATMAVERSAPQAHSNCTPACVWYGQGGRSAPTGSNQIPTTSRIYVDCSSSVSWAIFYATQQLIPGTTPNMASAWVGKPEYTTDFDNLQSGDVLTSPGKGHVVMFIGIDTNGKYLYVHASSSKNGIKIDAVSKGTAVGKASVPISMTPYYGN